MDVFLTDGNSRKTLAATRSLGRRGLDVVVGDISSRHLSAASRFCRQAVSYPCPYTRPRQFSRWLVDFISCTWCSVLIPMSDVTVTLVIAARSRIAPHIRMLLPPRDAFEAAMDKDRLLQLAQHLNIPIPQTYRIASKTELHKHSHNFAYPVVVKSRRSRVQNKGRWRQVLVEYARNPDELKRIYSRLDRISARPLIQEVIVGPGCGYFALTQRGTVLAEFAHERIREKPPSGGVSVVRRAVPPKPQLRDYARRLLDSLQFSGPVMVEFKWNNRTREPVLMEINSRFWGSLQLAIDAGVDFPFLLYQLLMEGTCPPSATFRHGMRTRWLLGDLDHLLTIWLCNKEHEFFPSGTPGRLTSLAAFFADFGQGTRSEIFRWDDPGPGFREMAAYLRSLPAKARYAIGTRSDNAR